MNKMKFMVLFMSIAMIFGSCGSMNNTGKGAAIGGGSGAALGAILGGVIGKGKGAAIGAAIGTAVGAGTGALIGKKMERNGKRARCLWKRCWQMKTGITSACNRQVLFRECMRRMKPLFPSS